MVGNTLERLDSLLLLLALDYFIQENLELRIVSCLGNYEEDELIT